MKENIDAILLIGPTGSGKTPLGDYMAQKGMRGRRCHHFDFGHELRTIGGLEYPAPGFTADDHAFIRDILNKGLLLEDRHFPLAEKIFRKFLLDHGWQEPDAVVLNGLPRHLGQAREMDRLVRVTHILVLECGADDVCTRIAENTGGDRTRRTDDAEEMVRKKIALYHLRTTPLIEHYEERGCSLVRLQVDAASTAEIIRERFLASLSF